MILRYFPVFLMVFLLVYKPFAVQAQICTSVPATITTMKEPDFGAYNLWDTVYGDVESAERFESALTVDDELILAGSYAAQGQDDQELLIVKLDRRGRELWARRHDVKGLTAVKRLVPHPKGYMILASVQQSEDAGAERIWLGFLDKDGALTGNHTIVRQGEGLLAQDVLVMGDNGLYAVAGQVIQDNGHYDAVIYVIDGRGRVMTHRMYPSGSRNSLYRLVKGAHGAYYGVGTTQQAAGSVESAWVIRFDKDLKLSWSKTYPRGLKAALYAGAALDERSILVGGQAKPQDGGDDAAWLVRLDTANGEVIWERYYRGARAYEVTDLLVARDNEISLVLKGHQQVDAAPMDSGLVDPRYDFTRLMTINARGELLLSEDYLNAKGASPAGVILGKLKERIVYGATLSADRLAMHDTGSVDSRFFDDAADAVATEADLPVSVNGWVLSTPDSGPYDDPCDRGL